MTPASRTSPLPSPPPPLPAAVVDLVVLLALRAAGVPLVPAHHAGFLAGAAFACLRRPVHRRPWRLAAVLSLAALLRGVAALALSDAVGLPELLVALVAAPLSQAALLAGLARFVLRTEPTAPDDVAGWRRTALLVAGFVVVLRLFVALEMDLLPEEAYYWSYGQHLALGYLDHPPVAGWSIRLFTELLGKDEIAVRLPALLYWGVAAFFVFRLTANLFDRASAWRSLVLFSVLPIWFSVGLVITPDAPLHAAWAGTLYFLERALLGGRTRAFLGAGVCLGFGMASKYMIALAGGAALLLVLLDARSRRRLLRPEPWLGVLLAALLFSPVVIWNLQHDWASFTFQGARRWTDDGDFSLHLLLGSVVALLTPVGAVAAGAALLTRPAGWSRPGEAEEEGRRRRLFAAVLALAPLAVLAVFSLDHHPKLNWTGPMWLAVLPMIARQMGGGPGRAATLARRVWPATAAACVLSLGAAAHYVAVGLPGAVPLREMKVPVAWEEWGAAVDEIARTVEAETGEEPFRTGTDPYFQSSEMAFYTKNGGPEETTGRHIVSDRNGLMWQWWAPRERIAGRDVLFVTDDRGDVADFRLASHFVRLGEIHETPVVKDGDTVVRIYWRVGHDYRPVPSPAPPAPR